MKLAIISTYPPQKCGVALLTKRLVSSFFKLKVNLEVITFRDHIYKEKFVNPIIEKNNLNSYIMAAKYIKKNNFDIVLLEHEYGLNQLGILLLLIFLRLYKVNTDIAFHTVVPYRAFLKQIPFKLSNMLFAFLSRHNFVHTTEAKNKLKFLDDKVKVIPLAIPSIKKIKSKHRLSNKIKVLSLGFITFDKGIDIACEAIKNVDKIHFYIVGIVHPWSGKQQYDYLKKIKNYAANYKNIHLINRFISETEKTNYMLDADFILLPYRLISQSAILTEVWAHEKIPICSDIQAFREEIGHDKYGVLFKISNKDSLVNTIRDISKDKDKQKSIILNIRHLKKRRSFDSTALNYLLAWKNENTLN